MTQPAQNTENTESVSPDVESDSTVAEPAPEGQVEPAPVENAPDLSQTPTVHDHEVGQDFQGAQGAPADVAPAGETAVSERPEFQDPSVLKDQS